MQSDSVIPIHPPPLQDQPLHQPLQSATHGTNLGLGLAAVVPYRPKLLVVDDDVLNIQVVNAAFAADHQVFSATSGEAALKLCAKVLPDLVLLDIYMPEMDGFTVCKHFKATPGLKDIPVVFITSADDEDTEVLALDAGAVDFISKPIQPKTLRARVTTQLALQSEHRQLLEEIATREVAQKALEESQRELMRSNADLEQFAYAASHDLMEPLRSITSCVQLLRKRYEGKLDARADEFISHAVSGAERMQILIQDLLAFSRINTGTIEPIATSMDAALSDACKNLHAAIALSAALITHDPLPSIKAQGSQMTQLLQNLLANAIKFRGDKPAIIHVGAIPDAGQWLFSVTDQGIGIEPQYFSRIFQVFKRLHTRTEYEGTGIGLALCNSIVQRHGGRIWVESEVGKGSTFFFTLPPTEGDRA